MGKVAGAIYVSIYVVVCGAVLAQAAGPVLPVAMLFGLSALLLLVLCFGGYRLDGPRSSENTRET